MTAARARMKADTSDGAVLRHSGQLDAVLVSAYDMWVARRVRNVTISIGDHLHLNSDIVEGIFAAMCEMRAEATA